jgi:uncharacterized protein
MKAIKLFFIVARRVMKWRKWFRIIHRDFGYLFFGVTVVYAVSGIALNHLDSWDPNYVIKTRNIKVDDPALLYGPTQRQDIISLLEQYGLEDDYKNHYNPSDNILKIFLDKGSVIINTKTGNGLIEEARRRIFIRESNYLHYNPIKYWTWFSDLYAGALIVLAVTGLFLVRGKKGITGRGAWMTVLGILIPLIFLFIYFY